MSRSRAQFLVQSASSLLSGGVVFVAPQWEDAPSFKYVVSALVLVATFLSIEFVRRYRLPEVLALGYFWNFIQPVAAAIANGATIRDGATTRVWSPTEVSMRILVPTTFGLADANTNGLDAVMKKLNTNPAYSKVELLIPGDRARGMRASHGAGGRMLLLDAPSPLNAIRHYYQGKELSSERAEKVEVRSVRQFRATLQELVGRYLPPGACDVIDDPGV